VFNRVGVEAYICDALSDEDTAIDWFPREHEDDNDNPSGDDQQQNSDDDSGRHRQSAGGEDDEGDFDIEDHLERNEMAVSELQSAVHSLKQQNSAMATQLAGLQQMMEVSFVEFPNAVCQNIF